MKSPSNYGLIIVWDPRLRSQQSWISFCASTGLGRSTARRYLTSKTIGVKNVVRIDRRKHKPTKYSANAKKQLIRVWRLMGMPSGKYMAAVMLIWLDALEAHNEIAFGLSGYNPTVRAQLLSMSAATIDRYLKAERDRLTLKGIPTTKPGALGFEVEPSGVRYGAGAVTYLIRPFGPGRKGYFRSFNFPLTPMDHTSGCVVHWC